METAHTGAEVLVIERTGSWGGAAAMAGGLPRPARKTGAVSPGQHGVSDH
ncbi:hypothetical protein [[Mycobacterium] holstebronense]|uniref:Uncharacterized protein n=1 Tax=[Mycobacterium] holstebronense TaxID=3064288 RepID=A0ABM9M3G0_9MYCO|nr:hypothetical protein [Mycolicibacter sp. MU0102]CAJ1509586.1 hypothetical protein MU0102_003790 [Mycolicibacter sp. MU0102]